MIDDLKTRLTCEYDLKDLREAHWILGMEIIRDRDKGTIQLSQKRYVMHLLEQHGMSEGRSVSTPMEQHLKLLKLENSEVDAESYQSAPLQWAF